jgi:hypothetical protein
MRLFVMMVDHWKVVKNADYTSGSYDDALKRERCWIKEI